MKKAIGSILATGLGLALLVYSALRSLDFIGMTLDPSQQILAYFALAALDGGILAWLLNYLYGARGGWQRAISIMMVLIDFAGAVAMFTLDTLVHTGNTGMTARLSPESVQIAVIALSGVIAANIGAVVAHHLTDPETRRRMAEEEAQGAIDDAVIKTIQEKAGTLAAQLAQPVAQHYANELLARNTSIIKGGKGELRIEIPEAQALPVTPPPNPTTRQRMR